MTVPATLNTADLIIRRAMSNAGWLALGDDPSSEELAEYMGRLNTLINFYQTEGLKLWLQNDLSVTLTAGTATYTFGTSGSVVMSKPLRIIDDGYFLDANSNRRPIALISRNEYNKLSNITEEGPINSYWPDKGQNLLTVKFWMTPDAEAATGTAHLIIQQQATNFVSLTDLMNFPVEWLIALEWGLAHQICTGQPASIVKRCTEMAMFYKEKLENWDVEDADSSIQPDQQGVLVYRTR